MATSMLFTVGQCFSSFEDINTHFVKFRNETQQPLVIAIHSKRQVVFKYRHGVKQKSKCTGARPNQHYLYKECPSQINLFCSKDEIWKVTKINLDHNHTLVPLENKVDDSLLHCAKDLFSANAKDAMIAEVLQQKTGKHVSRKYVQNLRGKLSPAENDQNYEKLENFLHTLENKGGRCSFKNDCDGNVRILFVASSAMLSCFRQGKPSTIQVDVSFCFNSENYKVLAFCYYSALSGKSEIAALAFLTEESLVNIKDCMIQFKTICVVMPVVFLVDKDFTSISAITSVFKDSVILLCKFHVIKFMKQLISTAYNITVESKNSLLDGFKNMLNRTDDIYEEKKSHFLSLADRVKVRIQTKYVLLTDQFLKNWDSIKKMWVYHFRQHLPLMGDNTTNRIERSFWTLKQHLRGKFHATPPISVCVRELITFLTERLTFSSSNATCKSLRVYDKNPAIRKELEGVTAVLTELGVKQFHKTLKSLFLLEGKMTEVDGGVQELFENGSIKLYKATGEKCECSYWCQFQMPCRHILFSRKQAGLELFEHTAFHERYLATTPVEQTLSCLISSDEDIDSDNVDGKVFVALTDKEKFAMAFNAAKQLADILSLHGTPMFLQYMEELKVIETNARRGVSLLGLSNTERIHTEINASQRTIPSNTQGSGCPEKAVLVPDGDANAQCTLSPHLVDDSITQHCQKSSVDIDDNRGISQQAVDMGSLSKNRIPLTSHNLNLKFKDKVKMKGRPKRKTKQLTFNKKDIDRSRSGKNIRKKTSITENQDAKQQQPQRKRPRCQSECNADICIICHFSFVPDDNKNMAKCENCFVNVHKDCYQADGCPACGD